MDQVDWAAVCSREMRQDGAHRASGSTSIVKDKATAEALKPYYHYLCKRPCFHDEYLDAFNNDNVTLVDTKGQGVERITPRGVVVAGQEYELDCLIYATGFDFMQEYTKLTGFDIHGAGGQSLTECWATARERFFGLHTRGFPNLFMLSAVQRQHGQLPHVTDERAVHLAQLIPRC